MIEFKEVKKYVVRLEGKTLGQILPVPGGWVYKPKGSKAQGEVFPTLSKCMNSLED